MMIVYYKGIAKKVNSVFIYLWHQKVHVSG